MPFKKMKNGKFKSPGGRTLSARQVRAYYAQKRAKKKGGKR
jgi:penicillin V acylase-like amidase (Ntn superfamily)|tara:strand:+ start:195 stop:317 length:123 start_codon:yes stop_codon:yes gene_type:complete